jgi:hypothetical protein
MLLSLGCCCLAPCGILMSATSISPGLHALAALLDEQAGRYRELNGARHLGEYLDRARTREVGSSG